MLLWLALAQGCASLQLLVGAGSFRLSDVSLRNECMTAQKLLEACNLWFLPHFLTRLKLRIKRQDLVSFHCP